MVCEEILIHEVGFIINTNTITAKTEIQDHNHYHHHHHHHDPHLDGSMCQGGVAGGVIMGPRPSYGPEGGDNVEVIEPGRVED